MKKKIVLAGLLIAGYCSIGHAQVLELVTFITNKVVKAIDLKVQQMQNTVIAMQNAQRQAENELSRLRLSEIGAVQQKQKELYRDYYASLQQVKPVLSGSKGVQQIINRQKQLVGFYNTATAVIRQDQHLSEKERTAFVVSCATILQDSYATIQKLSDVLRSDAIVAKDAERLQLIDQSAGLMEEQFRRLQVLFNSYGRLSSARTKNERESAQISKLYGL